MIENGVAKLAKMDNLENLEDAEHFLKYEGFGPRFEPTQHNHSSLFINYSHLIGAPYTVYSAHLLVNCTIIFDPKADCAYRRKSVYTINDKLHSYETNYNCKNKKDTHTHDANTTCPPKSL